MTPHKPPIDNGSDPALSKLFHENASGEPSATLDAAILAAAHEALAPRPRQRPWWLRLQAPFAVAATVVLAVMLTLTMEHNPPETLESGAKPEASDPSPLEQKRSDSAVNAEKRVQSEAAQAAKPAAPEAKTKSAETLPPPKPALAPPPASPAAESALADRKPAAPPMAPPPAAPATAPSAFEAPSGVASGAAGKLSERADQPAKAEPEAPLQKARSVTAMDAAPAPASAAAPVRSRSEMRNEAQITPRLSAEEWISRIRQLRQQGQEAEATRQLQAFRKAYPDYNLPEDLR